MLHQQINMETHSVRGKKLEYQSRGFVLTCEDVKIYGGVRYTVFMFQPMLYTSGLK